MDGKKAYYVRIYEGDRERERENARLGLKKGKMG